jgi:hypothetical protein
VRKTSQKLLKAETKSSFDYSKEISSEHDSGGTEPVTPSDKQSITPEGNIIDFLSKTLSYDFNFESELSKNPFLLLVFVKNSTYFPVFHLMTMLKVFCKNKNISIDNILKLCLQKMTTSLILISSTRVLFYDQDVFFPSAHFAPFLLKAGYHAFLSDKSYPIT